MNIQSLKHFLHIANEAEHTYDAKAFIYDIESPHQCNSELAFGDMNDSSLPHVNYLSNRLNVINPNDIATAFFAKFIRSFEKTNNIKKVENVIAKDLSEFLDGLNVYNLANSRDRQVIIDFADFELFKNNHSELAVLLNPMIHKKIFLKVITGCHVHGPIDYIDVNDIKALVNHPNAAYIISIYRLLSASSKDAYLTRYNNLTNTLASLASASTKKALLDYLYETPMLKPKVFRHVKENLMLKLLLGFDIKINSNRIELDTIKKIADIDHPELNELLTAITTNQLDTYLLEVPNNQNKYICLPKYIELFKPLMRKQQWDKLTSIIHANQDIRVFTLPMLHKKLGSSKLYKDLSNLDMNMNQSISSTTNKRDFASQLQDIMYQNNITAEDINFIKNNRNDIVIYNTKQYQASLWADGDYIYDDELNTILDRLSSKGSTPLSESSNLIEQNDCTNNPLTPIKVI